MPAYYDDARKTWYCQFYYTDWTGKKRKTKKRGFKLKREAEAYERNFKEKESKSCDMLFSNFVEVYLDDMRTRLKGSTIDTKEVLIKKKVLPYFSNLKLSDIKASTIRKWQNELISYTDDNGKHYSDTYLKTINNQTSAIFNYAVKYYSLPENPCRIAGSMGKKKAGEMLIWTLDEFNKFIECVDNPSFKLAFEILFWTGARVGECIALTPADILENKIISINKTYTRRNGEDVTYDPKTTKSCRKINIPDFLYNDICEYMGKLYGLKSEDRIFYFTKSALNKALPRYAEIAAVKRIRVHDLRHSHASLLIEMGQPILLISERLGHESIQTTLETYAHLYPNKGADLADALQQIKFPNDIVEPK